MSEPTAKAVSSYPTSAIWGQTRAYLAKMGLKQTEIDSILGKQNTEFTHGQHKENCVGFARGLRKAELTDEYNRADEYIRADKYIRADEYIRANEKEA